MPHFLIPAVEPRRRFREGNDCNLPAGDSDGGQFGRNDDPRCGDSGTTSDAHGGDWVQKDGRTMTPREYSQANPHAWYPGRQAADAAVAFDALPDDADVIVFHATDAATAKAMLAGGVDPSGKPRSLARDRYEAGEEARFAPGHGLSRHLYVGTDPMSVDGFGRHILAIRVKKGRIEASDEQKSLSNREVTPGEALSVSDAVISGALTPDQIRSVEAGGAGRTAVDVMLQLKGSPRVGDLDAYYGKTTGDTVRDAAPPTFTAKAATPEDYVRAVHAMGEANPFDDRSTILDGITVIDAIPRGDSVYLTGFRSFEQGKGHGTRVLQKLTNLADKMRVALTLTASPLPVGSTAKRSSKTRLTRFYKRHGFVPDVNGGMIRRPTS